MCIYNFSFISFKKEVDLKRKNNSNVFEYLHNDSELRKCK